MFGRVFVVLGFCMLFCAVCLDTPVLLLALAGAVFLLVGSELQGDSNA